MKWFLVALAVTVLGLVGCDSLNPYEPELQVSSVSLQLDSSTEDKVIMVRNVGEVGSELLWQAVPKANLVVADPPSGRLKVGEEQVISVSINNAGLELGEVVRVRLGIESNANSVIVGVSFTMTEEGLAACGNFPQRLNRQAGRVTGPGGTTAQAPRNTRTAPYVPGELLVQYKLPPSLQGSASGGADLALQRTEARVSEDFALTVLRSASSERPALVKVADEDVGMVAAQLRADPRVAYVEPNYRVELLNHVLPNDPLFGEQWNLQGFGLPEAWDIETGEQDAVIAVIDSGVDMQHEDLVDKLVPGCDFYNQDNDPSPLQAGPNASHGTHVAGIAAAAGNNALGITGVAYGARVLPINIFDEFGESASVSDLLDAMLWAAGVEVEGVGTNRHPADIINMSLGVDPSNIEPGTLQSLNSTAERLSDRGVVLIAAAGNGGSSTGVYAPANLPSVLAVGSVKADYRRSSFSNYAAGGQEVDFMAPGGEENTCGLLGVLSTFPDNSYTCLAGTSMAVPFVAGVVALLLSQDPSLSPGVVKAKLIGGAWFDDSFMTREAYGAGIICADRALGARTLCGQ